MLEGTLEGSFENENFDQINMNYFQKGALFGEALALANIEYSPIQLRALEDSLVLYLDPSVIYRTEAWDSPSKKSIIANLVRGLSLQNVFLNLKIRIHTQKSIRDKVLIYLYSLPAGPDGWKTVPFSQTGPGTDKNESRRRSEDRPPPFSPVIAGPRSGPAILPPASAAQRAAGYPGSILSLPAERRPGQELSRNRPRPGSSRISPPGPQP